MTQKNTVIFGTDSTGEPENINVINGAVSVVSVGDATLYRTETLDMSAANQFIISDTIGYNHITILGIGLSTGTISVKGDYLEAQTDTIMSGKLGMRTTSGTDNHTTAIVDVMNNTSVERGGLCYTALRVYVSTTVAATTGTIYVILSNK